MGAKPAVSARDLASGSPSFSLLAQRMATDPRQDMPLRGVMASLEEVASRLQRALFTVLVEGSGDAEASAEHISR